MVEEIEYSTPVLSQGIAASSVLAGNLSKTNLGSEPAASTILFFFSFLSFFFATLHFASFVDKKNYGMRNCWIELGNSTFKGTQKSSTRLSGCLKPKDFGTLYNI